MNADIVKRAVADADPEFVAAMERMPEPPPNILEKISETLPKLHELFLRKRQAAQDGDQEGFMRIAQEELEMIAEWDRE